MAVAVDTTTVWKACTSRIAKSSQLSAAKGPVVIPPGPSRFLAPISVVISICSSEPEGRPVIVEVESNDNCDASVFARFKEIGQARPLQQIKLYDRNPEGEWYWVIGWSDNAQTPTCQAYAQLVEDSGAGLTHLVYGGLYGLRFKPVDIQEAWSLESRHQWGDTYLSLANERDLRYAKSPIAS